MNSLQFLHRLLILLTSSFLIHFCFAQNAATQQEQRFKFNGEYGLWVENSADSIRVHWITAQKDSGSLKAIINNKKIFDFSTARSQVHSVSFLKPQENSLTLEYGSRSNPEDRHATEIVFEHPQPQAIFSNIDSIFVIGDIHGEYDALVQLLKNGGLLDTNLNWAGRKKHLVALGDIFDRGHDVTKTLWFLYKLERQAAVDSGAIHILLGNHEIMIFANDLRYLSEKEKAIADLHQTGYQKMFDINDSILGRWLAAKPGIMKIDKLLFAHGGITPSFTNYTITSFNDSLRHFLHHESFEYLLDDSLVFTLIDTVDYIERFFFLWDENSAFWYRGYVLSDTLKKELRYVLKKFDSKIHLVAHTPVSTISELYDGKLIAVDLPKPATEMILLVRHKKKKYNKFRIKLQGPSKPFEISN